MSTPTPTHPGEIVERAVAALDANPVFHMSLGSKELFHSNFLWWLARRHRETARAVFGEWSEEDAGQTKNDEKREGNNLDVVFYFAGRAPLVIENKVFSLPDIDQLNDYARDKASKLVPRRQPRGSPARKAASLVLLTMADPRWDANGYVGPHGTWRVKRYSDLCRELAPQVELLTARNAYDGQTLALYCNFVRTLCDLHDLVHVRTRDEQVDVEEALIKPLEERRIADGLKKLRMHEIMCLVKDQVAPDVPEIQLATTLTNKSCLVEGFCSLDGTNDVGWQYQDGQFRLAIRVHQHPGNAPELYTQRKTFVDRHPTWFDFAAAIAIAGPHVPADPRYAKVQEGDYHKFDHFLYRPYRPATLAVGQLIELARTYSRAAVDYATRHRP